MPNNKIYLYPDFTNLYKINKKFISNRFKESVCIIPNSRMIDKNNNNYQLYLNFFKLIIDYFISKNIKFFFLIHSSDEKKSKISDLDIIKLLVKDHDRHIDIVKLEDPKLIKMQISNSKFIISSRYHGLINGLSQNVPSIATSWSHKYKELLGLYDLEHLCIYDLSNKQSIIDILNDFNKSEVINVIIENLRKKNQILESKTKEMWEIINNKIIS